MIQVMQDICGNLFEDTIHFFLECPLYQHNRTSLFNSFNNVIICKQIGEELFTLLFKSGHKFIRQTCRFNK